MFQTPWTPHVVPYKDKPHIRSLAVQIFKKEARTAGVHAASMCIVKRGGGALSGVPFGECIEAA